MLTGVMVHFVYNRKKNQVASFGLEPHILGLEKMNFVFAPKP